MSCLTAAKILRPIWICTTKTRPEHRSRRVNVDFPDWVVESLDREASRIGVTRQSIVKMWIAERIDAEAANRAERQFEELRSK